MTSWDEWADQLSRSSSEKPQRWQGDFRKDLSKRKHSVSRENAEMAPADTLGYLRL